jgi:ribosomal protein L37AE/L43A
MTECKNCGEPFGNRRLVIAGMWTCPACFYWHEGGSSPRLAFQAPVSRLHPQEERLPSELLPEEVER